MRDYSATLDREIEVYLAREESELSLIITYTAVMEHFLYGDDSDGNRGDMRTEMDFDGIIIKNKEGHVIDVDSLPMADLEDIYKIVNSDLESLSEQDFE